MFRANHPELITLIATPSLARQRGSRSDIAGIRWYDRGPLRNVASLARAVRDQLRRRVHA
ncbi:hypothetical protein [Cupriavidus basilensis]